MIYIKFRFEFEKEEGMLFCMFGPDRPIRIYDDDNIYIDVLPVIDLPQNCLNIVDCPKENVYDVSAHCMICTVCVKKTLPAEFLDVLEKEDCGMLKKGHSSLSLEEIELYKKHAKKIIRSFQPHLHDFIEKIKIKYGQIWLCNIELPHRESLYSWCRRLDMYWGYEVDNISEKFWPPEAPGEIRTTLVIRGRVRAEGDYLTEHDWENVTDSDVVYEQHKDIIEIIQKAHYECCSGSEKMYLTLAPAFDLAFGVFKDRMLDNVDEMANSSCIKKVLNMDKKTMSRLRPFVEDGLLDVDLVVFDEADKAVSKRGKKIHKNIDKKAGRDFYAWIYLIKKMLGDGVEFSLPSHSRGFTYAWIGTGTRPNKDDKILDRVIEEIKMSKYAPVAQ